MKFFHNRLFSVQLSPTFYEHLQGKNRGQNMDHSAITKQMCPALQKLISKKCKISEIFMKTRIFRQQWFNLGLRED